MQHVLVFIIQFSKIMHKCTFLHDFSQDIFGFCCILLNACYIR